MKFTNATNFDTIPDGNYQYQVIGVECGIQSGGKTSGSPNRDLKLLLSDEDGNIVGTIQHARLILHESIWWKVCTFLVSANYLKNGKPLAEGDDLDPATDLAVDKLLGLRGWCSVKNEEGDKTGKHGKKLMFANVEKWLTDRDKLPRAGTPPQTATKDNPFA